MEEHCASIECEFVHEWAKMNKWHRQWHQASKLYYLSDAHSALTHSTFQFGHFQKPQNALILTFIQCVATNETSQTYLVVWCHKSLIELKEKQRKVPGTMWIYDVWERFRPNLWRFLRSKCKLRCRWSFSLESK